MRTPPFFILYILLLSFNMLGAQSEIKGLFKLADAGDPDAALRVADAYANGTDGLEKNTELAVKYYESVSNSGKYPRVNTVLGRIYAAGDEHNPKDVNLAVKFFALAARAGESDALAELDKLTENSSALVESGYCRARGFAIEKDIKTAQELYLKAIKIGGDPRAYGYLGILKERAKQDMKAALKFYLQGAENCDPVSCRQLSRLYKEGSADVKKDRRLSDEYKKKARKYSK